MRACLPSVRYRVTYASPGKAVIVHRGYIHVGYVARPSAYGFRFSITGGGSWIRLVVFIYILFFSPLTPFTASDISRLIGEGRQVETHEG